MKYCLYFIEFGNFICHLSDPVKFSKISCYPKNFLCTMYVSRRDERWPGYETKRIQAGAELVDRIGLFNQSAMPADIRNSADPADMSA